MNREKIEALIDELTPCFFHRETGKCGPKLVNQYFGQGDS